MGRALSARHNPSFSENRTPFKGVWGSPEKAFVSVDPLPEETGQAVRHPSRPPASASEGGRVPAMPPHRDAQWLGQGSETTGL